MIGSPVLSALRARMCEVRWSQRAEPFMSKNNRSKVHPNYKARHRVRDWAEYDKALVRRGDLRIWFTTEAIFSWQPRAAGLRGGQRPYSDGGPSRPR